MGAGHLITLHLSEIKVPVMDRLMRSHFLKELTGKFHLTKHVAVFSIKPDIARSTLEAQRLSSKEDKNMRNGGVSV